MTKSVLVLGAGVAGLSTAVYLQRAGCLVTVLDPLGPAGGASFGNAGLLSPDSVVPIAMPGILRKVPGWMRDPMGPLAIRPGYAPTAAPWLLRWVAAGRLGRVEAISAAMRALHSMTFGCWNELLGAEDAARFIRRQGQVYAWESHTVSANERIENDLRAKHGVRTETLTEDDLRQIFPGIARHVVRGLLLPDNGHTLSPGGMVRSLAEKLREAGGTVVAERALKLIPTDGGWMVFSNLDNRRSDAVVVAAGAWSRELLRPLGLDVPLQAERGYHAWLPNVSALPGLPISFKDRGFALTPMDGGLRAAGTVEIDARDAPPNEQRAKVLADHVRRLFPDLRADPPRLWMGARPGTPDSLPVLGPAAGQRGLFLCLGHGHFGMTGGPPSGKLVADTVLERPPAIALAPYSLARFQR